eukprot:CAMPEP_0115531126 /NCGR_PEP_ID=MMETSP0271-20121206/84870_1 /TAXON_ID=71861 /ORGANISM="Scrippsiella trochoidea, Strain CCMP3099" /LENGTH=477 /DNA_ID=CAMNT_0002963317 /DNA_START=1 /DNA_END=1435 /DNA_ORIENTATION=+
MRSDRFLRFWHRFRDFSSDNPLVCFSGDFLAPSLTSAFTKGRHMMEALELLGVHVGTLGNHDFDFGVEHARQLLQDPVLFDGKVATSKWVLTNITTPDGAPLAGCRKQLLLKHAGVSVGIIALSENWLADAGLGEHAAKWVPEVEVGRTAARELRAQGAKLVLDIVAPKEFKPGEDKWLISGCEFEDFSVIRFNFPSMPAATDQQPCTPELQRVSISPDAPLPEGDAECEQMKAFVARYEAELKKKLREPVGRCTEQLDCRKFMLRTREVNSGNFFADLCLRSLQPQGAEIGFLISGVISSNRIWPAGDLTMEFIVNIFPWEGTFVLLELRGKYLREALEHGVSLLPRRYGRFPHVAGLSFAVDVTLPSGSRVSDVRIRGIPLDEERAYLVATTDYIAQGGDDYDVFVKHAQVKVGEEFGPGIHSACRDCMARDLPSPVVEGRIQHKQGFRINCEVEELDEIGDDINVLAWGLPAAQ